MGSKPGCPCYISLAWIHSTIGDVTPMELDQHINTGPRQHRSQLRWPWCNKRRKVKGIASSREYATNVRSV
jgi:hypothetical protein